MEDSQIKLILWGPAGSPIFRKVTQGVQTWKQENNYEETITTCTVLDIEEAHTAAACRIILFISSEDNFFYDCVANNINIPKFKVQWEEYLTTITTALLSLKGHQDQKSLLIDASKQMNLQDVLRDLTDYITSGEIFQKSSLPLLGVDKALSIVSTSQTRTSKDVDMIRSQIRDGYEPKLIKLIREKVGEMLGDSGNSVDDLIASNAAIELNQTINDPTVWRDVRAICQRLFTIAQFYAGGKTTTCATALIETARARVNRVASQAAAADAKEESLDERVIHEIVEALSSCGRNFLFRHKVFAIDDFYPLLLELLQSPKREHIFMAMRLIGLLMEADFQQYGNRIAQLDKGKPSEGHIARILVDKILLMQQPLLSLRPDAPEGDEKHKQLKEYADLLCAQHFTCLQKLIRGSEYHASHVQVKDVEKFIDIAETTCESGYSFIASEIYSYFTQLLTYGTKEVALCILGSKKLKKQVVGTAYKLLQEGHFSHLKFATQFFDTFVIQLKKTQEDDSKAEDDDEEKGEEGEGGVGFENTKEEVENMEIDSKEVSKSLAVEMGNEAYELVMAVNSIKRRRANLESNAASAHSKLLLQERKKLKLEEYQITFEELEHKLIQANEDKQKLTEKIHNVELVNMSLQEKVSDLEKRLRIALEQQTTGEEVRRELHPQASLPAPKFEATNSDPILKITDPALVSPQEAQRFITALQDERTNMSHMRDSLCGGLVHLGADLYSSQVHFLNEILQNIDDNLYGVDTTPFAKLRFSTTHIVISYNELGFRPQDVLSICKLAVSTKTGGDMIGQKGLGWKSVFACTHNPIVVSGSWSFYFQYIPGQTDELAFITPHWIEKDSLPAQLVDEIRDGRAKTYLFLPLLPKLKNNTFLDSAIAAIDGRILINLRNLKQLVIIDERKHREISMKCHTNIFNAGAGDITFEQETYKQLREREVVLEVNDGEKKSEETFHVFECDVEVPLEVRTSEPSRRNAKRKDTSLLLAFPSPPQQEQGDKEMTDHVDRESSTIPVYAFLPVCDVGLHFMINADWVLVTNRESIPGEKMWNQFIQKQLARFFLWLVCNRTHVRTHVGMYAPRTVPGMNASWVEFVSDVNSLIAKYLPEKLLVHSGRPRLPDLFVCKLVSDEIFLQSGNVEIIRCDEKLQEVLKHAGVPVVSVKDILECFRHQKFQPAQHEKWWADFFNLLSDEILRGTEILNVAVTKPIFKLRGFANRCALPASSLIFTTDDPNMNMWRKMMYIIDPSSSHELLFIQRSGIAQPLSSSELIHHILRIHLATNKPGTQQEVWDDLVYIREHFAEYLQVRQLMEKEGATQGSLYIPVAGAQGFALAEDTTLPTLLSFPIPFYSSSNSPQRVVPSLYNSELSHLEVLRWELFFLHIGCKLPLLASTNYHPPLLISFAEYTPTTASLAHQILVVMNSRNNIYATQLLNFVQSHPVRTMQGTNVVVSLVCESQRFRGVLPCVEVPEHSRPLAALLGVTLEPNLSLCIKSLHALVQQGVTSPKDYYEWLLDMRHYTHQMAEYNLADLKSLPILYLANPTSGFGFYALKDVYVCSDESALDAIELLCQTVGKTIISKRHNDRFLFFADMLRSFGSQPFPSVKEVILCMEKLGKDKSIIRPSGASLSRLTNEGFIPFKQLYLLLERILVYSIAGTRGDALPELAIEYENAIDWVKRQMIQSRFDSFEGSDEIKVALRQLPFITHDKQIISFFELDTNHVYAALQNILIGTIDGSGSSRINFLEVSLARACPNIVASMGLRYLELNSVLKFVHSNITLERVASGISDVAKSSLGLGVTALAVAWLNIELLIPTFGSVRTTDENFEDNVEKLERYALREGPFFVLMNSLLVCATSRSPAEAARRWAATLAQLMQRNAAQQRTEISNTDAVMRAQELLRGVDVRANVQWVGACGPPDFCNSDAVIFPITSETAITEDYFVNVETSQKEKLDEDMLPSGRNFGVVSFERRALDDIFADRVKISRGEGHRDASGNIRAEGVIVDERVKEVQAEAALNAEHFFSRFLAHHYGDKFDPLSQWRSSLRRKVYRDSTMNSTLDDSCGYDFEVRDSIHLFDTPSTDKVQTRKRMCFFEVKGCAGPWRGEFHISENEVQRKERAQENKDREAYVVVLVEHAVDPTRIQFVDMVVWSDLPSRINIRPNSYIATLAPAVVLPPPAAHGRQFSGRGRGRGRGRESEESSHDIPCKDRGNNDGGQGRGYYRPENFNQQPNRQQTQQPQQQFQYYKQQQFQYYEQQQYQQHPTQHQQQQHHQYQPHNNRYPRHYPQPQFQQASYPPQYTQAHNTYPTDGQPQQFYRDVEEYINGVPIEFYSTTTTIEHKNRK